MNMIFNKPERIKNNKNLKNLRKRVGLVFQFPEYQLFEETIAKDIGFGPKNFEYSDEEAEKMAKEALNLVALITNILLNICRNTLINDIKINKIKFILLSLK